MMSPKVVVSKRQTLHLTKDKTYKVLECHYIKSDLNRVSIICDTGQIIETSIKNFLSIEELREIKLNQILK